MAGPFCDCIQGFVAVMRTQDLSCHCKHYLQNPVSVPCVWISAQRMFLTISFLQSSSQLLMHLRWPTASLSSKCSHVSSSLQTVHICLKTFTSLTPFWNFAFLKLFFVWFQSLTSTSMIPCNKRLHCVRHIFISLQHNFSKVVRTSFTSQLHVSRQVLTCHVISACAHF